MAATDNASDVEALEALVGHPAVKWRTLTDRIQDDVVTRFEDVQESWLDVVWTLDSYRRHEVVPRGMGKHDVKPGPRLAAVYRNKGNWYAELMTLLLGNQTSQKLAPRTKVRGFSQLHQIDVAWPDRNVKPLADPRVCLETKVTGAPAYGDTSARGAMSDWSNRRKELKFAATDLKLARRGMETQIDHWDEWRLDQDPLCYFVWGARLNSRDKIDRMVREVQALTKTYLDGAGVFAWRENADSTGYEPVPIDDRDPSDRVSTVDDVLRRIASRIKKLAPTGKPPEPIAPADTPIDVAQLTDDAKLPND